MRWLKHVQSGILPNKEIISRYSPDMISSELIIIIIIMAATALPGPEIQVYASFPLSIVLDANNIQPTPWQWVHCLTLSVETLRAYQFSPKPYKWLRYAIGVVVGVEGDLSFSSESPNVVDYDSAGLPTESIALYYHASDEERQRMFPIDPNIGRTNITSSVATARRTNFRNDVADRDGWEDILTSGMDEGYCDAVHLLSSGP